MQSYFGNNTCVMCCDKYNIATWKQTVTTSVATNSDEEKDESKDTDSEAEAGKDNEVEEFSPTTSQSKPQSKRAGRKAQWLDNHVADMIDVICSDEYFKKKSLFTNSKHSKNGEVYSQVLEEIRRRYSDPESFPYSTEQMRTKFKRSIVECKKVALMVRSATGIRRFQEERGYGPWFNQLFGLVKSRDSCNPEMAEEPSVALRPGSSSGSSIGEVETLEEGLFVPVKCPRKAKESSDVLTTAVEVLKEVSEKDTAADLLKFFQE